MPPKNKKQLEEEAKRLEQERIKKQEQERRLQQERKKYAAETLITGLILPVSNQLLSDFAVKQSSFIYEKLSQVLNKQYPELREQKISRRILKQIIYHMKNLRKLFKINEKISFQESKEKYLKVRVSCGFFLTIYLNNNPGVIKGGQKNKQVDENLLRKMMLAHSQNKGQNQQKVFEKKQVLEVMNYLKEFYFDHFMVLHKCSNFPKRQDQKQFNLYIATPIVEFNSIHTKFIDLSANKNQGQKVQQDQKNIL